MPDAGQPGSLQGFDEWVHEESQTPPLLPVMGPRAMTTVGSAAVTSRGFLPGEKQHQQLVSGSSRAGVEGATKNQKKVRQAVDLTQAEEGEELVGGPDVGEDRGINRGVARSSASTKQPTPMRSMTGSTSGNKTVGNWQSNGDFACLTNGECSRSPSFMMMCMGCDRVLRASFRFG